LKSFLVALAATFFIGVAVLSDLRPPSSVLAQDNTETLRKLEAELMRPPLIAVRKVICFTMPTTLFKCLTVLRSSRANKACRPSG
jgi:hypothetical protein